MLEFYYRLAKSHLISAPQKKLLVSIYECTVYSAVYYVSKPNWNAFKC